MKTLILVLAVTLSFVPCCGLAQAQYGSSGSAMRAQAEVQSGWSNASYATSDSYAAASGGSNGSVGRRTPVRSILANVQARRESRRSNVSVNVQATTIAAPACEASQAPACMPNQAPTQPTQAPALQARSGGGAVLVSTRGSGEKLQAAIASATYRAQNGIQHHSHYDLGRRSGVGFSSNMGPTPGTCLGHGDRDAAYASACVGNRCYSTVID